MDEISDEEVSTGRKLAEKWLEPFLTVGRELPNGAKEIGKVGDWFIYESKSSSVERISAEVSVPLGDGRDIVAHYFCDLHD